MKSIDIRIIGSLGKWSKTVTGLANALDVSTSYISERLNALESEGVVKKEREGKSVKVSLKEPLSIYLKKLSDRFNLKMLLGGRKDILLPYLLQPRKVDELERETSLSKAQIYRDLRMLKQIGVIKLENERYSISPRAVDLIRLVELLIEGEKYRGVEEGAIVLWRKSNNVLKKAPQDVGLEGSHTAFSRFGEYGIEYFPVHRYVYSPGKELSVEEILTHSLVASETRIQKVMSAIFFLKNRERIDWNRTKELSRKFGVFDLYLNMLSYLNNRKGKGFPPWDEFLEKAELYGIKMQSFEKNPLLNNLDDIGRKLTKRLDIYLIGGLNLILRGVKDSTKDIDVVLRNIRDFEIFRTALEKTGYRESIKAVRSYGELSPSTVMVQPGRSNFDIFVRVVCGGIELSEEMSKRAELFSESKSLRIYLLPLESIFIFKSITDRVGDLEDAKALAVKYPLDWNRIWEEVRVQEERSGQTFAFAFLDTLEVLEDRWNIFAPIIREVRFHCLKKGIELALKEPRTIKELRTWVDFPRHSIERAVRELEMKKKIKVDRSKKPYVISLHSG